MGHPAEIAPLSFCFAVAHFLPPLEKEKHSKLTGFIYAMSILIKLRERVILSHLDTYISYKTITYAVAYQTRYPLGRWKMKA